MAPRIRERFVLRALALAATAAPSLSQGNVLVVDASGAGDHTDLQAAIDAAAQGDVLLVKSGRYTTFNATGKSLAIVADVGATPLVDGAIRTRNLTEDQTVVISGLRSVGRPLIATNDSQYGLRIKNCVGHVRVQDCVLTGARGLRDSEHEDSWEGVLVQTSDDVVFTACAMSGGPGLPDVSDLPAGNGLNTFQCKTRLYDCTVQGGAGQGPDRADGGKGYSSLDSFLFASNTTFRGGDGNAGACPCGEGGDGGNGIETYAPARTMLYGCSMTPGAGGPSCSTKACPGIPDGSAGTAVVGTGALAVLGGVRRGMVLPALTREHTVVEIRFEGAAGDRALAIFSEEAGAQYLPDRGGLLLVDVTVPSVVRDFGTIPASGVLEVALSVAELDPGVEAKVVHVQALFTDAANRLFLASPRCLVVLDQSF